MQHECDKKDIFKKIMVRGPKKLWLEGLEGRDLVGHLCTDGR
jgi:hypothetical protein